MEYITHSPSETEAVGAALARVLKPGTVIAYRGDLGAGKTAFTRGLARGLGVTERVSSPTYTIVNEYLGGKMPLFHFDMYRLGSEDELFDIGWEDYLELELQKKDLETKIQQLLETGDCAEAQRLCDKLAQTIEQMEQR